VTAEQIAAITSRRKRGIMKTYDLRAGEHITNAARSMVALATSSNETVTAKFNDIELLAYPNGSAEDILKYYNAECDRRRQRYISSPEYKERQIRAENERRAKAAALRNALAASPDIATITDKDTWDKTVEINADGYGKAVVEYASLWARLMEGQINSGSTLDQCAEEMSHLADTDGITGFMYGCAVSILSRAWKHGEALRRWHNLKTQIGTEGEAANASGGVLNPALLSIG
jgi:hypothetical protein